jgi:hypothetical protein
VARGAVVDPVQAPAAVEVEPAPNPADASPRVFQGVFQKTRRVLGQGPKLDYQLVDANGRRIALLDLSSLLITESLQRYEGEWVSVFGTGTSRPGVSDVIIRVETIRIAR